MTDIRPQDVVTTGGTQSRAELSEATVANYAEAMAAGTTFPPIVVFHDGSTYWLADGFHRLMAHVRNNADWVTADVRIGTRREAVLHSVASNSDHGLPRTNADKRHAVLLLLKDEEWTQWSDSEIARRCCVSRDLVQRIRPSLAESASEKPATKTYTNKHGQTATMNTANIGRRDSLGRENGAWKVEGKAPAEVRAEQIAALSREGNSVDQIANEIGLSAERIRGLAKAHGIQLADSALRYNRRIDNRRVVEQTVMSIDACAQSTAIVPLDFSGLESRDLQDWLSVVSESLAILRKFHARLKEAANV